MAVYNGPLLANEIMGKTKTTSITGEALALEAARHADEKKAEDIVVIDVRGLSTLTDYFVVCSGTSAPHLRAVRKEVVDGLKVDAGVSSHSLDGDIVSQWLVVDYVDVIVHIFHPEKREHYRLEELWGDAPRIAWSSAGEAA